MERQCDCCGDPYEAKTKRSRFCSTNCRVAYSRGARPTAPATPGPPVSTKVADALVQDLTTLGVVETYEAAIAIGMAKQLDSGTVQGSAYVSLSKEVDRRVDALRLKAEKPDDPVRLILGAVEEKQSHLRAV